VGLREAIGSGPVALDTAVFIYFMEEHPRYLRVVEPVFRAIDGERLEAVTSAVTLLEVLVIPYRAGDLELTERYEAILTRGRGLRLVEIDRAQLRAAAQLRARHGVRAPDALQLVAGLSCRCTAFVTNDRDVPDLPGLPVLQLEDHIDRSL